MANPVTYKISPSDFAYLWQECKHCYYQKIRNGIYAPGIFPSMFTRINGLLQNSIMGKNLQEVHPDLPDAIIETQEGWVRSKLIPGTSCYIGGRFDILSRRPDGTYTIIDFKITTPDEEKIQKYATQLHAYKYAFENPAEGKPITISHMGIVSVNPDSMKLENGKIVFHTTPNWHPVTDNMDEFFSLVGEISKVLSGGVPDESLSCNACIYRAKFTKKEVHDGLPF